jgi:hypothetical protein
MSTDHMNANLDDLPRVELLPRMAPEAYTGLAGRIVRTIEPHSEADPVAILINILLGVGNAMGRGPHALVERTRHTCGEFAVLVGMTSKGRKGQSWSMPSYLLVSADHTWRPRIKSGLSSGEGLIANVRDARYGQNKKGETVVEDEGESDKRLLVSEPELATVLKRMQGDTNSLSPVLREAWESGDLATLTKNSPLRATGAHISVIAHTTREELITSLTETDRANGFANRFIYLCVRRSKCLPDPPMIPDEALRPFIAELERVMRWAQPDRLLLRDAGARALWEAVYPKLSEGEPGLVGAVLARAEAHVLRLSLIYAALETSPVVTMDHLEAALAVWDYAEASARRIFGDLLGLTVADAILAALRSRGPMTRDDITNAVFSRNRPASEIEAALRLLEERGKARKSSRPSESGKGRPAEIWEAT